MARKAKHPTTYAAHREAQRGSLEQVQLEMIEQALGPALCTCLHQHKLTLELDIPRLRPEDADELLGVLRRIQVRACSRGDRETGGRVGYAVLRMEAEARELN